MGLTCGKQFLKTYSSSSYISTRCHSQLKLHDLLASMPRDPVQTEKLKNQRVKIKEKSMKYPPGIVHLQVLGSGAHGAPTALYLFTDQARYLFNCGEGSQRLAHEHKIKLSKLEHIFITYGSWKNIGGLPGVALTLQDVGVPQIVLHGPNVVDQIFPATRRFVVLKNMSIRMASCTPKDTYEDNSIKVNYIPLIAPREKRPSSANGLENVEMEDHTDYYQHERSPPSSGKRGRRRSSSEEPAPKKTPEEDTSMCYAVRLHPKPGALCLEKCVEAGVPPGPLLGLLKAGEDVVLACGKVVRSADVTLSTDPGPVVLVIDVPNEKFLPCLQNNFSQFQSAKTIEDRPDVIVHFTPTHIMSHPSYEDFMNKFPIGTKHLLMNDANSCLGSTAVHRVQYKLNLIDPHLFPLLKDPGFPNDAKEKENIPLQTLRNATSQVIITGRTKEKILLRPRREDDSEGLRIEPEGYVSEATGIEGFPAELTKLKAVLKTLPQVKSDYPNLVFLGTGSCIPNKTRNTSAILLNISETCRVLLDCGEGTAGQIIRHYGLRAADQVFSSLRAIYISHLHADHHIGLVGILQNRTGAGTPLYLLAPNQIMTWLKLCNEYFESILDTFILVSNADLRYDNYHLAEKLKSDVEGSLGMVGILTTFVRHCPHAFGLSLTSVEGWKLTYSGDTMPSEQLIDIGADSDVLIHEATMEDELAHEAKLKMHCTTSEAIEVGRRMRAKSVILTHFSQRYAKLPRILGEDLGENIGVAFDNMKIRFGDLPKLKYLYPALKLVFREDMEELEEKAYKRQMKKERAKR